QATCIPCVNNNPDLRHGSISPQWYGTNFCGGAQRILNRAALYNAVAVGDVVIIPNPNFPTHTMVVVSKSTNWFGYHYVYIRGFNNIGTLGTGQRDQYDNSDRDIDVSKYWHRAPDGNGQVLGQGAATGGKLYVIPYV